jgi:hypothetical protein
MTLEIPDYPLPSLDRLGASVPKNLDAKKVRQDCQFATFSAAAIAGDEKAATCALQFNPNH